MSDRFKQLPPDLRRIAARRGGQFPTTESYQIVDGGRGLRGHGGSQVPVWGDAYRITVEQELCEKNVPHELNPEFNVHARILSLVYYLESVQTEQRDRPRRAGASGGVRLQPVQPQPVP